MVSQITSRTIVYSSTYSGADQWKISKLRLSPHKGPVTRKIFPFDDVIMNRWPLVSRHIHFWSKINIWYVNCARATAFIFDTRTDVLVKVSKFLRQKMSRPGGGLEPQPSWFLPIYICMGSFYKNSVLRLKFTCKIIFELKTSSFRWWDILCLKRWLQYSDGQISACISRNTPTARTSTAIRIRSVKQSSESRNSWTKQFIHCI